MLPQLRSSCSWLESQYLRGKVGGKESALYSGGWQPGERVDSCSEDTAPLLISEQELIKGDSGVYRVRDEATCRTAQSALTVILKFVLRWSDQHHLDWFKSS